MAESDQTSRIPFASLFEKLEESPAVQQIKSKWEEIDPRRRALFGILFGVLAALMVLYYSISSISGVYDLRKKIADKRQAIHLLDSFSGEIGSGGEAEPWPTYLANLGASSGLNPASVRVGEERPVSADGPRTGTRTGTGTRTDTGASGTLSAAGSTSETLIDINLSEVKTAQIVSYLLALENGNRPVKVRSMTVERRPEPPREPGQPPGPLPVVLNATLVVSAFDIK